VWVHAQGGIARNHRAAQGKQSGSGTRVYRSWSRYRRLSERSSDHFHVLWRRCHDGTRH
jgi:hypothetical protein